MEFLLPDEDKYKRKQFKFDYPILEFQESIRYIGMEILDYAVLIIVMILRLQI